MNLVDKIFGKKIDIYHIFIREIIFSFLINELRN